MLTRDIMSLRRLYVSQRELIRPIQRDHHEVYAG